MDKKIILTGDRPTGHLHLGHYLGSLKNRVELQNSGLYQMNVLIADMQALTDNAHNPQKIVNNVYNVVYDYLSVGIDPNLTTICLQSALPALSELTMYYMNLISVSRLERNPTIKTEIKLRNFKEGIPMGFLSYPISQAADITGFNADLVPGGEDQKPLIELCRDIVDSFNKLYEPVLVLPEILLSKNKLCQRLPGIDGKHKMSKSLNNAIFLVDTPEEVFQKVMKMYTDKEHISVNSPGHIEGNVVFTYLDALCQDEYFDEYLPEYKTLDELKDHYKRGGLGDVTIKKFLISIINHILNPIREERTKYKDSDIHDILELGNAIAKEKTNLVLQTVKEAIFK